MVKGMKEKKLSLCFWQSLKKRTFSFVTLQYPYVRTSENKRFVCLLDNHATMAKRLCINFGTWTFSYLHRIYHRTLKEVIRKYTWFCDKPYSKRTGPLMGTWVLHYRSKKTSSFDTQSYTNTNHQLQVSNTDINSALI